MTKKQDYLYFREWAAVRKAQPTADRHELHIKALGTDKSHTAFTNDEFDKVLGVFRAISKPASLNDQLRQLKQARTRLLFAIQNRQIPCLAVLLKKQRDRATGVITLQLADYDHAETYVQRYIQEAYHCHDLMQLRYQPEPRRSGEDKSDLELVRDTMNVRINTLRGELGLTIHQMLTFAGLPCPCKFCCRTDHGQRAAQTLNESFSKEVLEEVPA